jgi:hypothetical protein
MIKLKNLLVLKEEEDKAPVSVQDTIEAFFTKNKSKLEKLSDDDDWDAFYELGFEAFPDMEEGDVAQAMNRAMLNHGWAENEDVAEMPTEKDLELAVFGDKKLQKGINTAEYDKLAKLPKNPENIKESFKKKGRVSEITTTEATKVDSFLNTIKNTIKNTKTTQQIQDFIMIARLDPYASFKSLLSDLLLFYNKNGEVLKLVKMALQTESKKKEELCEIDQIEEAEYKGRKVKLGKPFYTPGGPRKRAVYVRNDKGNVVKVGFGEPGMKIKKNNPNRRKSFRARHNCDNPGPRWKARYWSCRAW